MSVPISELQQYKSGSLLSTFQKIINWISELEWNNIFEEAIRDGRKYIVIPLQEKNYSYSRLCMIEENMKIFETNLFKDFTFEDITDYTDVYINENEQTLFYKYKILSIKNKKELPLPNLFHTYPIYLISVNHNKYKDYYFTIRLPLIVKQSGHLKKAESSLSFTPEHQILFEKLQKKYRESLLIGQFEKALLNTNIPYIVTTKSQFRVNIMDETLFERDCPLRQHIEKYNKEWKTVVRNEQYRKRTSSYVSYRFYIDDIPDILKDYQVYFELTFLLDLTKNPKNIQVNEKGECWSLYLIEYSSDGCCGLFKDNEKVSHAYLPVMNT